MQRDRTERGSESTLVLDAAGFRTVYREWSAKLEAALGEPGTWAIVGIKRRGSVLAKRLWQDLRGRFPKLEFGELDISLYRDDYHLQLSQPQVLGTEIAFAVDGARILLVDDVLFTGRTVRAALDLILDYGRPKRVALAVFIDRGHRELPIAPDVVGRALVTEPDDRVQVRLQEVDGVDQVRLTRGKPG
jgi:pyrimidine operon attenuation protein/uracil phosphoribosyltransferase